MIAIVRTSRLLRLFTGMMLLMPLSTLAGPHGSELDLTLMPTAGGMEGVGIVRPQDPLTMLFGNPATLTQFKGKSSFLMGASYVSPDLEADGVLATPGGLLAFSGESRLTDLAMPHAGVIHRLNDKLVLGMGLTGISGLGSDFRDVFPNPLGLVADLKLFGTNMSFGYQVSDQLSIGGTATLGIGSLQVGTVSSTAAVNNFGYGAALGFTYDLGVIKLGADYKSELEIEYEKVVRATGPNDLSDFTLTQPQEVVVGIASTDTLFKNTILALDVRWKNYSNAEGYSSFWRNQTTIALGIQHQLNSGLILRAGYSHSSTLKKQASKLGNSIGSLDSLFAPGFPDFGFGPDVAPISPDLIQLFQATLTDGFWQQGVSFGLGLKLTEHINLDLNIQYAFDGEELVVSGPQVINIDGSLLSAGMGLTWVY